MIPHTSSTVNRTTDVSQTSAIALVGTVLVVALGPLIGTVLWSHPIAAAGLAVGIVVRPLTRVSAMLARRLGAKIRAGNGGDSLQQVPLQVSAQQE